MRHLLHWQRCHYIVPQLAYSFHKPHAPGESGQTLVDKNILPKLIQSLLVHLFHMLVICCNLFAQTQSRIEDTPRSYAARTLLLLLKGTSNFSIDALSMSCSFRLENPQKTRELSHSVVPLVAGLCRPRYGYMADSIMGLVVHFAQTVGMLEFGGEIEDLTLRHG